MNYYTSVSKALRTFQQFNCIHKKLILWTLICWMEFYF
nr:MAG TPA: hypothetical protein [Caudoviricetes sp.]